MIIVTEIPMADPGPVGARPREVTIAGYLVLLDAITGLIVGAISYYMWEDWTAGLGIILALIAFLLAFRIWNRDPQAWNLAVIFNLAAIFLYMTSWNVPGAVLSLISVIYLMLPNVKVHFEDRFW